MEVHMYNINNNVLEKRAVPTEHVSFITFTSRRTATSNLEGQSPSLVFVNHG